MQTFKKSFIKSALPLKAAHATVSHAIKLNSIKMCCVVSERILHVIGRQIQTKFDALIPSPAHTPQGRQAKGEAKTIIELAHEDGQCYDLAVDT